VLLSQWCMCFGRGMLHVGAGGKCRCKLLLQERWLGAAVRMVCVCVRVRVCVCLLWSGHAGAAARVLREGAAVVWAFWTGLLVPLQGAVAKGCWHFKTLGPAT
jgi:hypothetical protein